MSETPEQMPDNMTDRPLVTFALFAYNQEEYIREAVEGAFAQTYKPLEIILSDDFSSDRTFEIMQEMAAEYEGPHEVRLNQNKPNLGTALHVQNVANHMSGELLVVAAGDDISCPERTETLVNNWLLDKKQSSVLHSAAESFNVDSSTPMSFIALPVSSSEIIDIEWFVGNLRKPRNPILAPTAAYSKKIFTDFPQLSGGSIIEDGPLIVRGFLAGGFLASSLPLVKIRKLPETSGTGYTIRNISRWNRFIKSRIISAFSSIADLKSCNIDELNRLKLEKHFLSDIKGLSRSLFSSKNYHSAISKFYIFIIILFRYPIRYGIKGKIVFALEFSDLLGSRNLLKLKKLSKMIKNLNKKSDKL